MIFARIDQRARHAWTQRAKLIVHMLTTTAYGSLGVGLADPVLKGLDFGVGHILALAFGLICVYFAVYLAPEGERDERT